MLFAKDDFESVYLLVPVHPDDRVLLAMQWKGGVFVDAILLFGLQCNLCTKNVHSPSRWTGMDHKAKGCPGKTLPGLFCYVRLTNGNDMLAILGTYCQLALGQ